MGFKINRPKIAIFSFKALSLVINAAIILFAAYSLVPKAGNFVLAQSEGPKVLSTDAPPQADDTETKNSESTVKTQESQGPALEDYSQSSPDVEVTPPIDIGTAPSSNPAPRDDLQARSENLSGVVPSGETDGSHTEEEAAGGVKMDKERISLDLKGIEVTELFRILSLKMGLTIVPSKSVAGRVNIFLNNLTLGDALDVILMSQDLAAERSANIISVMTGSEYERLYGKKYNEKRKFKTIKLVYAKPASIFNALGQIKSDIGKIIADEATGTLFLIDVPEKLDLMEQTIRDLDKPLPTETFDLKYAKSADMKTQLSAAITSGPGELFVDERSSKVVVSDLPEKMKKIKRIVKAFDSEPKQVFIEAEIVSVTLSNKYQRGVEWEKFFAQNWLKDLDFVGKFPVSGLATSAYKTMSIGTVSRDNYSLVMQFLETYGVTKVLSRPRIAAVNNQEAKILVGTREAFITQTISQAQGSTVTADSVEFVDVGIKLNVVPTINEDDFVTIKIKPEVSEVTNTIYTGANKTGSVIPIVKTSEAETVVKIKDGTMIMIGGLMEDTKKDDGSGLPGLQKIPLIGSLFGTRTTEGKRTELIIFITPHIFSGEAPLEGKEADKWIPPDIVPDDLAENIIADKVKQIRVKSKVEALSEDLAPIKTEKTSSPERPDSKFNIQDKMKGIKKF